jgi:hypothetical protein
MKPPLNGSSNGPEPLRTAGKQQVFITPEHIRHDQPFFTSRIDQQNHEQRQPTGTTPPRKDVLGRRKGGEQHEWYLTQSGISVANVITEIIQSPMNHPRKLNGLFLKRAEGMDYQEKYCNHCIHDIKQTAWWLIHRPQHDPTKEWEAGDIVVLIPRSRRPGK